MSRRVAVVLDFLADAVVRCDGRASGTGAVKLSDSDATLALELPDDWRELDKLPDTDDNASTRLLIVSYSVLDSDAGSQPLPLRIAAECMQRVEPNKWDSRHSVLLPEHDESRHEDRSCDNVVFKGACDLMSRSCRVQLLLA